MFLPRPTRNGQERALADISAQIDILRGDCCRNRRLHSELGQRANCGIIACRRREAKQQNSQNNERTN